MNIEQAIHKFKGTTKWATFSEQTQRQYGYLMENSLDIIIDNGYLRDLPITRVDPYIASQIYHITSERGVTVANQTKTAFTALFTTLTGSNPFKGANLIPAGKQTVDSSHVVKFLTVAYSKFKWRNAGLIVQMVYELGQNITDLLELKWSDIDFKDEVVHVGGVAVPMTHDLKAMLTQQHADFGFQEWVVPNPNIHTKEGYSPYGQTQISRTLRKIREAAHLPEAFNMAEVRRLGFMAMLDEGYTNEELALVAKADDPREFARTIDRLKKDM